MKKSIKKAPITLSKVFPASHSKAGSPTGFRDQVLNHSKIHTIRSNYEWWKEKAEKIKKGEMYLSLREWTGKPYNSPQEEWTKLSNIGLQRVTMTYSSEDELPQVWIGGVNVPIQEVAKNDGLDVSDFVEWFFGSSKENVFEGVVIHFTNFRYSISDDEMIKELGDALCDYCPWKNGDIPHKCDSVCEGSYCHDDLTSFLDENEQYFDK